MCPAGVPLEGWEAINLPLLNAGSVPFSEAALSTALQPQQQPPGVPVGGSPPVAANQTASGRPMTSGPLLLRSAPEDLPSYAEPRLQHKKFLRLEPRVRCTSSDASSQLARCNLTLQGQVQHPCRHSHANGAPGRHLPVDPRQLEQGACPYSSALLAEWRPRLTSGCRNEARVTPPAVRRRRARGLHVWCMQHQRAP